MSAENSAKPNEISVNDVNITTSSEVSDENPIFVKIDYNLSSVGNFEWLQDNYEIVTVDPVNFKKAAANGTINLNILDKDLEIQIYQVLIPEGAEKIVVDDVTTVHVSDPPRTSVFKGEVVGVTSSNAWFLVDESMINGKISIGEDVYNIQAAKQTNEGDWIHVIYLSDSTLVVALSDRSQLVSSSA